MGPIPLTAIVVVFILKAHRDAVSRERPKGFLEPVIEFAIPFAPEELHNLGPAFEELHAITPFSVLRVGEGNALGVARIPGILGSLDLLTRSFLCERRERRTWIHVICYFSVVVLLGEPLLHGD